MLVLFFWWSARSVHKFHRYLTFIDYFLSLRSCKWDIWAERYIDDWFILFCWRLRTYFLWSKFSFWNSSDDRIWIVSIRVRNDLEYFLWLILYCIRTILIEFDAAKFVNDLLVEIDLSFLDTASLDDLYRSKIVLTWTIGSYRSSHCRIYYCSMGILLEMWSWGFIFGKKEFSGSVMLVWSIYNFTSLRWQDTRLIIGKQFDLRFHNLYINKLLWQIHVLLRFQMKMRSHRYHLLLCLKIQFLIDNVLVILIDDVMVMLVLINF